MVDLRGNVDSLRLDDVLAGAQSARGVVHVRRPAIAVDPHRRRAYVVSVRSEIVEVDLQHRRARLHRLSARSSLLERPRDLVEPRAEAQPPLVGRERTANWLEPGVIAVSGHDSDVLRRSTGALEQGTRPAGVEVIDVRRWQTRTLDQPPPRCTAPPGCCWPQTGAEADLLPMSPTAIEPSTCSRTSQPRSSPARDRSRTSAPTRVAG